VTLLDNQKFAVADLRALANIRGRGKSFDRRALDEISAPPQQQTEYITREVATARDEASFSHAEEVAAWHTIKEVTVGELVTRFPIMLGYLWGTADAPESASEYASWHLVAQVQYAILFVLMVVGLYAARRRWSGRFLRTASPLLLIAVYETLLHLVFSVDARYTIPARPALLLLSAAGAVCAWGWVRARWPEWLIRPDRRA
jgi:hypothetical protein